MFANEIGDGPWRPTSQISDRVRDRHGFPAGSLIRRNGERALNDRRW